MRHLVSKKKLDAFFLFPFLIFDKGDAKEKIWILRGFKDAVKITFMGNAVTWLTSFIQKFGPWGVFVAGIIEQIIVPIPSPMVPMGGGFFLIAKKIPFLNALVETFLKVALPFSLGSTLGATMVFLIALKGAMFIVDRFEKFFGFGQKDVEKFKKKYFKGSADELTIFALMAIPVVPSVLVSAVCGAIQIPALEFYLFTFLGLIVRGIVLGMLGWWFGEAYLQMAEGINKLESIFFIIIGVLVVGLLYLGYKNRDRILGRD